MKNRIICKGLSFAVIILFFSVGIQPAIAVDLTSSISDDEDDCKICPSVEELVDSKDIEKYKEILDKIKSLKEENEELNTASSLCAIFFRIIGIIVDISQSYVEFLNGLFENDQYIPFIIGLIPLPLMYLFILPFFLLYVKICI
jgi:hypothetical protein